MFFSFSARGSLFPQGPITRRRSSFHPRFNMGGPEIPGMERDFSEFIDQFLC